MMTVSSTQLELIGKTKKYLEEKRDVCIYKLSWGQKPSNDFELNEKRLASLDVLIKVIEN